MKQTKARSFSTAAGLAVAALVLVMLAAGCSKSTTTAPSFIGTYYGIIGGTGGNADTIVITSGTSSSSVVMVSRTSIGSLYTINGTVSGAALTIPLQTYLYNGNTDSVSGTGTLSGSALTISYRFANATVVNNYTYAGTKQ